MQPHASGDSGSGSESVAQVRWEAGACSPRPVTGAFEGAPCLRCAGRAFCIRVRVMDPGGRRSGARRRDATPSCAAGGSIVPPAVHTRRTHPQNACAHTSNAEGHDQQTQGQDPSTGRGGACERLLGSERRRRVLLRLEGDGGAHPPCARAARATAPDPLPGRLRFGGVGEDEGDLLRGRVDAHATHGVTPLPACSEGGAEGGEAAVGG